MHMHLSINLLRKIASNYKTTSRARANLCTHQSFLTHPEDEIEDEHQILDAHLSPGQRRHRSSLSSRTILNERSVCVPVSRRRLARAAVCDFTRV